MNYPKEVIVPENKLNETKESLLNENSPYN